MSAMRAAGLQSGSIVIISSTTDPSQVQELAVAIRARGADIIEAPIAREAFALADAFGVEAEPLRKALLDSSGASWAMAHWDLMENTSWAHKDMVLMTAMGDQAGLSLPLAGLLRERLKERWDERGIHLPPPGAARRAGN